MRAPRVRDVRWRLGQALRRESRVPPPHPKPAIEAPLAGAGHCEVQEYEAVERGQLAMVDDRPEALRRMREKVRESHQSRQQEGHRPREQSDDQQCPADDLHYTCNARQ